MSRALYALKEAKLFTLGMKTPFGAHCRTYHPKPLVEHPTFSRTAVSQLDIPHGSVELHGRNHLPGSWSTSFPRYLLGPKDGFPLAYTAVNGRGYNISEWSAACRKCIDNDLPQYGCLHFRGLPISSVEQFGEFFKCLGYKPLDIVGIVGYRTKLSRHVFTASDDPKKYSIELHTESSHMHRFPLKKNIEENKETKSNFLAEDDDEFVTLKVLIMFCAHEPAEGAGGETALANIDEVTRNLDPIVLEKLRTKKIRYIGRLPDENAENKSAQSWQDRFLTKNRKEAEEHFNSLNISYEWLKCGTLRYSYILPAFRPHPITGKEVWFNQALSHHASYLKVHPNFEDLDVPDDQYPFHTCYGDGTEFEPALLQHIREVSWSCARGYRWRTGDVLVLDNFAVMHSRLSFTGERRMVTSLIAN